LRTFADDCIDLTVTSPPYDNLRTYGGHTWDFEGVAQQLWRVTKPGGVVVWIVADATVNGSETLTSFKQAIYFVENVGFKMNDTMIWNKGGFSTVGSLAVRYAHVFEYMFILCKGKITTFNPLKDRINKTKGAVLHGTTRKKDGTTKPMSGLGKIIPEYGQRFNIWDVAPKMSRKENTHPAPFSEKLAEGHILSWSNPGDIVLDPMCGSGTTCKMAVKHGRQYVGIDCSEKYCEIARKRIDKFTAQRTIFDMLEN